MFKIETISSEKKIMWAFALAFGILYFFSNPSPQYYYDYTYRIAGAMLQGHVGLFTQPPSWLNGMVLFKGEWYSVFPLGSVLSILPFAVLKVVGLVSNFPARLLAGLLGAFTFVFAFLLSGARKLNFWKRIALAAMPVVGTWAWTNIAFGGAWQFALGFAVVGELAALYYVLVKPKYFLAGLFFALAAGNRTEIFILAPLFLYFIWRESGKPVIKINLKSLAPYIRFLALPTILLVLTLVYNYARFASFSDFGYARIPGVLQEPWYIRGIFSFYAIPLNFYTMLLQGWNNIGTAPYFIPSGFGGSILLSSPFLFLLFREAAVKTYLIKISWIAIAILTFILWIHGDPGGWQFSYRYGMVLIPWFYLILLFNGPENLTVNESLLFITSFIINAYATYLYYWTNLVK